MEEVSTNISRRSVALGAPSALALGGLGQMGALGSLGTLGTLGALSVPNDASAQSATIKGESPIDGFLEFVKSDAYIGKIRNMAKTYIKDVIIDGRENGSVPFQVSPHAVDDKVLWNQVWPLLSPSIQKQIIDDVIEIHQVGLPLETRKIKDFYFSLLVDAINNPNSQILKDLQHRKNALHHVKQFLRWQVRATTFANYKAKLDAAAITHSRRYLKEQATVDDGLEVIQVGFLRPSKEYVYKEGNKRKLVERKDLVRKDGFWDWMNGNIEYTEESLISNGKNSTALETVDSPVTSSAYEITPVQTKGIKLYVDEDVAKNGALENMSVEQTKRKLEESTELVSRMTGYVYESYVTASIALKAVNQAFIASVRFQLSNPDKVLGLNIAKLSDTAVQLATESAAVQVLTETQRGNLKAAVVALVGVLVSQVALQSLALKEAKLVAAKPVDPKESDVDKTLRQLKASLAGNLSVSFAAVGLLGFVGVIQSGWSKAAAPAVPVAFAFSDFYGGIGDIVSIYRNGAQNTAAGTGQIFAGLARIGGAGVSMVETVYKMYKWDRKATVFHPLSGYSAVKINSWAASAASSILLVTLTIYKTK